MGQGVPSPLSSGTARLVRIEVGFASHLSLSTSGSDSQHLHGALDYFIDASGVLGLNIRPSAMQQAWTPMFSMSLVPEELSFVQPCACQNFLNPRLILAGLDGEVEPLETSGSYAVWGRWQLGGWGSGSSPPKGWQLSLGFPKSHPKCKPGVVTLSPSQGRAGRGARQDPPAGAAAPGCSPHGLDDGYPGSGPTAERPFGSSECRR